MSNRTAMSGVWYVVQTLVRTIVSIITRMDNLPSEGTSKRFRDYVDYSNTLELFRMDCTACYTNLHLYTPTDPSIDGVSEVSFRKYQHGVP